MYNDVIFKIHSLNNVLVRWQGLQVKKLPCISMAFRGLHVDKVVHVYNPQCRNI